MRLGKSESSHAKAVTDIAKAGALFVGAVLICGGRFWRCLPMWKTYQNGGASTLKDATVVDGSGSLS